MIRKILLFLVCGVVSLIMLGVFIDMLGLGQQNEQPKGHILFSMSNDEGPLSIYELDLSADGVETATPQEFFGLDGVTVMQMETAQIGEGNLDAFYAIAAHNDLGRTRSNIMQMRSGSETTPLLVTDNELTAIRDLDYSDVGRRLAFSAQEYETALSLQSENEVESVGVWSVFYVDVITKELTYVAQGRDPQWSPDGKSIVYLGTDNLYSYNIESREVNEVATPVGYKFSFGENMNLDIAEEGNVIAITSPNDFSMYIGQMGDWNTPQIVQLEKYEQPEDAAVPWAFFWPTLAPTGNYLAVQFAETTTDDAVLQNPRVGIINTQTMEMINTWSIAEFDFDRAFIDEWYY